VCPLTPIIIIKTKGASPPPPQLDFLGHKAMETTPFVVERSKSRDIRNEQKCWLIYFQSCQARTS
jgi:hypothetical protein